MKQESAENDSILIPIRERIPDLYVELPYATENNFFKTVLYDFTEPSLRPETIEKLKTAQSIVKREGFSLKVWDGYRPYRSQCYMWKVYPVSGFVSNPETGYLGHSRGNTVDVTLVKTDGTPVEMPSEFDDFTERANRDYSDATPTARHNAELLENAMKEAGFDPYYGEWWHFSDTVEYPIIYEEGGVRNGTE